MLKINFITPEERDTQNNIAIANGRYRDDFEPGICYYMNWLHDPGGIRDKQSIDLENRPYKKYLSVHYWNDWAHIRPPLCLVLPNKGLWNMDGGSTNGTGWSIIIENGELPSESNPNPKITASPSIDHNIEGSSRPRWHGWLRSGILIEC